MDQPLDELYLTWLYRHVGSVKLTNPIRTYWSLLKRLYKTEFVWFVPNDDNRIEDGKDLRQLFLADAGIIMADPDWIAMGCSMLELLIVLSRALSFQAEGEPRDWFWHMIDNLGIHINDRDYTPEKEAHLDAVLHSVIYRNYAPDGLGGIFPLQRPERDQRQTELLYQLYAYVLEITS